MATQEDVRRIALSLPETTQDPRGFRFFVKDKQFAWAYMERVEANRPRIARTDVIAIRVANDLEKQSLLGMDSEKFFTTPHYNGYPAVLVRLPEVDVDLLRELLTDAWRSRAPRRLVAELDSATTDPDAGAG
jgi:hypothetical protein